MYVIALKSKVLTGAVILYAVSREQSIFLPFQIPGTICIPWLVVLFNLQSQQRPIIKSSLQCHLSDFNSLPLLPHFKGPYEVTRTRKVTEDHLPVLRSVD